jgi:hypothetical protein
MHPTCHDLINLCIQFVAWNKKGEFWVKFLMDFKKREEPAAVAIVQAFEKVVAYKEQDRNFGDAISHILSLCDQPAALICEAQLLLQPYLNMREFSHLWCVTSLARSRTHAHTLSLYFLPRAHVHRYKIARGNCPRFLCNDFQ